MVEFERGCSFGSKVTEGTEETVNTEKQSSGDERSHGRAHPLCAFQPAAGHEVAGVTGQGHAPGNEPAGS